MNRICFLFALLGIPLGWKLSPGQDEEPPAKLPVCPVCRDDKPNLIGEGVFDCNECGVLFKIPQHNKEKHE